MICGVVSYSSYSHYFEATPVNPQDVVTSCLYHSYLSHPKQIHYVPVTQELTEVEEEVHHPKLHQQVSNLLAARVLGFSDVGAEVPYHYGILVPGLCQGLLPVR